MSDTDGDGKGRGRVSEAERQALARRERAARTLRENLMRRKQQGRARRAGDADEAAGLPAARPPGDKDACSSGAGIPAGPAPNPDESPE